jgi:hypothetical protein
MAYMEKWERQYVNHHFLISMAAVMAVILWLLDLHLSVQPVPISAKIVNSKPFQGEGHVNNR